MSQITQAIDAVRRLGIKVRTATELKPGTFLPGCWIDGGVVVVHPDVALVGDVFHEAAHVAVTPSGYRRFWRPDTNLEDPGSPLVRAVGEVVDRALDPDEPLVRHVLQMGEDEAIAWEYAAILEAGMDPGPMFWHPDRFQGEGTELLFALSLGQHFGVNGLQASGMTTQKLFPKMLKWLQD